MLSTSTYLRLPTRGPNPVLNEGPFGLRAAYALLFLGLMSACAGPQLGSMEEDIDFGTVQVGTTGWFELDIELESGGPAETRLRLAPQGGVFFLAELPSPVLANGEAGTVRLGFHPAEMGGQVGVLVVEANNVEGAAVREIRVSGTGVAGPLDLDRDGFPAGEDCNDSEASVYPGAEETCDGLDTDCDPGTQAPGGEDDGDGDGWSVCEGDCDESSSTTHPEADELCDGIDNDCDTLVPEVETDDDGDSFAECSGNDCNDNDPAVYPGAAEVCDGLDGDCDGLVPDDEQDGDGDDVTICEGDCADDEIGIYPGATESCDGVDNDCDPSTQALGGESDGDSDEVLACADCDDTVDTTFPGAPELCDGIDNDCDTVVPDVETDDDGDGFTECSGDDCDDDDPAVYSGALEECFDGVDGNCDGTVNEGCSCPIWTWNQPVVCGSAGTYECPHETIAGALVAEASQASCSEVWLRPGTYTEGVTLEGSRELRGPGDPSEVVLDGTGNNRVLLVEEDAQVQLSSMTVTGGFAAEGGGLKAVANSFVSLVDMVFVGNDCDGGGTGGAVAFLNAEFSVVDSVFEDNDCGFGGSVTGNDGGAIASVSSLGLIEGNLFDGNTAGDASDVVVTNSVGPVSIVRNSFLDGSSSDSSSTATDEWLGGAVVIASNHVLLANNLFGGHTATEGSSGVFVDWASAATQVVNNVFVYGSSPDGGAIQFGPDVEGFSPSVIANNIVAENSGWGVYSAYVGQPAGLTHNDVWNNSLGLYLSAGVLQPPALFSLSVDPLFLSASDDADWSNDDFTLSAGSLCIDAGRPSLVWLDDGGGPADLGIFGGPYAVWTPPVP